MKLLLVVFGFFDEGRASSNRAASLRKVIERDERVKELIVLTSGNVNSLEMASSAKTRYVITGLTMEKQSRIVSVINMILFVVKGLNFRDGTDIDVVIGSSSKLITLIISFVIAKRFCSRLVYDVRDMFSDSLDALFTKNILKHPIVAFFRSIEYALMKKSEHVNFVSSAVMEAHRPTLENYTNVSCYSNGVDNDFSLDGKPRLKAKKSLILYAGNVGLAQGLSKLIPALATNQKTCRFIIYGEGRDIRALKKATRRLGNVEIFSSISRADLAFKYRNGACLLLHLEESFCNIGALPSKVFEYAASGAPMICGLSGYAKEFVEKNVSNAVVFSPSDVTSFSQQLPLLSDEYVDRKEFSTKYDRAIILTKFLNHILGGHR